MAIKGYMESTLSSSEIFNGKDGKSGINNINPKNTIYSQVVNMIKNTRHLKNEDIESAYISVKQITDSLTRSAISSFDNGDIVLLYNDNKSLSISQALPFITLRNKGKYITYVFMDKYISINRDAVMVLQAPILRDLLTASVISNGLKNNYNLLSTNQYLQKVLNDIYCKLVFRVLNRLYSIAADKKVVETIQYWTSRFFLTRIFGANDTPENIESIAKSGFKYMDDLGYQDIKRDYDETNPAHFSELLDMMRNISLRMQGITLGSFMNNWINYYHIPSTLAIDNIEYLIFMILSLMSGNNNIVNISASDIVKECKNIKSLRSELLKLI